MGEGRRQGGELGEDLMEGGGGQWTTPLVVFVYVSVMSEERSLKMSEHLGLVFPTVGCGRVKRVENWIKNFVQQRLPPELAPNSS
jgi:hypothetical protein